MKHCAGSIALLAMIGTAYADHTPSLSEARFFTAHSWDRSVVVTGAVSDGQFHGRELFSREFNLAFAPSSSWAFWLISADATAFGRTTNSRFRATTKNYSLRWRSPISVGADVAVQLDADRPGDGTAITSSSSTYAKAIYSGPRIDRLSAIYSKANWDYSASYAVTTSPSGYADAYRFTIGNRQPVGDKLALTGQLGMAVQTWNGPNTFRRTDFKLSMSGLASYEVSQNAVLQLGGDLFINGLPMDHALGSYLLYDPSDSVANSLKSGMIGYGAFRISILFRF